MKKETGASVDYSTYLSPSIQSSNSSNKCSLLSPNQPDGLSMFSDINAGPTSLRLDIADE